MHTIAAQVAVLPKSEQRAAYRRKRQRSTCFLVVPVLFMILLACLTRQHGSLRVLALSHRKSHFIKKRPTRTIPAIPHLAWTSCVTRRSSHLTHSSTHMTSSPQGHDSFVLEGLNLAQIEAVTQPLSSITRVVAGPGAGKTRVLTSRIAYLLHHDEQDSRILAVTFTKKAAGEMQQRLEKLLLATSTSAEPIPEPIVTTGDVIATENVIAQEEVTGDGLSPRSSISLDRVTLGTFHSVCAKILRWNGKLLSTLPSVEREMTGSINNTNLDGNFAIVDQNEQIRLVKECCVDLEMDLKSQDLKPQVILNALGMIKSKLALGQDPLKDGRKVPSKALKAGMKLYPVYRQKLLSCNALDFDDLILTTRELLTVHGNIREYLRRRWQHVLVDEFQDTSKSQVDLIKLLSSSSLLVVGDADQSIYSWRGAHVESMADFLHEFDDRLDGVHTVYLMENYRSTTNIVSAAQKIISSASSKQSDLRQDMRPMRGKGPTPRVLACVDAKAEASFVVKTIQDMIESGDYTPDSTVAIIYRTNAQSRAMEEACVQANMPYVVRGSSGSFYKRAEIQDCLCFLRLLRNGRDEAAMKRAMKTPSRGIGDVAYQEFCKYSSQVNDFYVSNYPDKPRPTPFDVLLSLTDEQHIKDPIGLVNDAPSPSEMMSKRALNRFLPFSMQMHLIRSKARKLTVADLLSSIVTTLDLRSHIDSISKSSSEFSDCWSNVLELRQAAQRYTDGGASMIAVAADDSDAEIPMEFAESPLGNFLDDVDLVTDTADDAAREDGVKKRLVANLMTIHASKGMEFDGVFLVGNEDGTLPTKIAIMEGNDSFAIDEEKRLCYVAMTRAKTHLVMTWRREVSAFNGNTFTSIKASRSRFLDILVGKSGKNNNGSEQEGRLRRSEERRLSTGDVTMRSNSQRVEPRASTLPRVGTPRPPPRAGTGGAGRGLTTSGGKPSPRIDLKGSRSVSTTPKQVQAVLPTSGTSKARNGMSRDSTLKRVQAILPTEGAPEARNGRSGAPKAINGGTPKANARAETSSQSEDMDSTWFYPIGSSVVHKRHGRGMVLPPPPEKNGQLMVRVQFEDGTKEDLPANGNDLHLNFT